MSFFRYPGGKAKLLNIILEELSRFVPVFSTETYEYREPFFGGGIVGINFLTTTNAVKDVWINDKDLGVACLWDSVINNPEELKQLINSFTPSPDAFYEFKEVLLKNELQNYTKVEYGFKKLAIHQISYSGLGTMSGGPLGGQEQKSVYDISCRWSPKYICKKIDNLNNFFKLYNIKCTNNDFLPLLTTGGNNVVLYLDPPYFVKGNQLYQCGFTEEDHKRLAKTLKDTEHKWVLSYDDCSEVRDLYGWANIKSIDVNYSISATKDKETGEKKYIKKPELIITR